MDYLDIFKSVLKIDNKDVAELFMISEEMVNDWSKGLPPHSHVEKRLISVCKYALKEEYSGHITKDIWNLPLCEISFKTTVNGNIIDITEYEKQIEKKILQMVMYNNFFKDLN